MVMHPHMREVPYSLDSFTFIGRILKAPYALLVDKGAAWKSMEDFIKDIKANPDKEYTDVEGRIVVTDAVPAAPPAPEIKVTLDGAALSFEVPPQIINGRTMVPLRAIFEAMGAEVVWDPDPQTVTATKGDLAVVLIIGDTSPTVDGEAVALDQPGVIVDGRTLAPLRFVAEAFGGTVDWVEATQTAAITK
jgi:hypothetical protein